MKNMNKPEMALCFVCLAGCVLAGCGNHERRRVGLVSPAGPAGEIPNFAKVTDRLYRGGRPSAAGLAELKRMGVKTVVSLRTFASERKKVESLHMRFVHISFKPIHPEDEDVLRFLKIVTNPANQPVFVHCTRGEDRTGMMIALYRMVVQGWDRKHAVAEMKRMGFNRINYSIWEYVENVDPAKFARALGLGAGGPRRKS